MGLPLRRTDEHHTYRDCRRWPEDERWELIGGTAFLLGSPATPHQAVQSALAGQFFNFLKG